MIKTNVLQDSFDAALQNQLIRYPHAKRENEWLRELLKENIWPVLLIFGSNHIEEFESHAGGAEVIVTNPEWLPS